MGSVIRNFLLGILLVCAAATRVSAQAPTAPPPNEAKIPLPKIPRVHLAPKFEDFLENHPREAELTVTDFRQNIPGDGTPPTESTTAYLSYDDKNLYVAFVCRDEPGEVRAHLSKREASDQDDGVGVLLDTFRDFHRAYYFFSNPVGVQTDAIYTEGQGYDYSFDTPYQFTKELSLRLILDYNATIANTSLVDLQTNLGSFDGGPIAPTKQFTTDVLFTYLLHPGTAV
jgi:hypothetical protein